MIYFLRRANGDIKIGTTEKYHQRLSSLIREHGDLELLGLMDGGYEVEQLLHQQFATERVKPQAEWFQPSEPLQSYISHHAHLSLPEHETGVSIRIGTATKAAIDLIAAEERARTGRRVTNDDAIWLLIRDARPEIVDRIKSLGGDVPKSIERR